MKFLEWLMILIEDLVKLIKEQTIELSTLTSIKWDIAA